MRIHFCLLNIYDLRNSLDVSFVSKATEELRFVPRVSLIWLSWLSTVFYLFLLWTVLVNIPNTLACLMGLLYTRIVLARLCIEIKRCYCCLNQIFRFLTEAKRNCFRPNCKIYRMYGSFRVQEPSRDLGVTHKLASHCSLVPKNQFTDPFLSLAVKSR